MSPQTLAQREAAAWRRVAECTKRGWLFATVTDHVDSERLRDRMKVRLTSHRYAPFSLPKHAAILAALWLAEEAAAGVQP